MNSHTQAIPQIFVDFGAKYAVNPASVGNLLGSTAFRQCDDTRITMAEMVSLLITAMSVDLNPFTREIIACQQGDRIVPVVTVDGWGRIINKQSQLDGMNFVHSDRMIHASPYAQECPDWIECHIYKKDCGRPIVVREYLMENYIDTPYWNSKTIRQLRHKAMVQCARYAFGLPGIPEMDDLMLAAAAEKTAATIATMRDKKGEASKSAPLMGGLDQAKQAMAAHAEVACAEDTVPAATPVSVSENLFLVDD